MAIHPRRPLALRVPLAALALAAAAAWVQPARATTQLTTTLVANGLTRPVFVTSPPGDNRLFIVEQRVTGNVGRIRIVKNGALLAQPFLTSPTVATGNEQGLLGLAFAPDYATSRRFYIHYNDAGGTTRLARYLVSTANADSAIPTGQIIYSQAHPFTNHNGGWLAFGSDGYLWTTIGDGGSADDPGDRAQNINVALGKVLRFDVSGAGAAAAAPDNPFFGGTPGLDEIWCYGLRNPWRCAFDRLTDDFIIADVGQNVWEEIDFAPAPNRGRKWNWGWKCFEGDAPYLPSMTSTCGSCDTAACAMKFPSYTYNHAGGACSVTGGYVYRGCQIPDLQGNYFFADYCSNQIFTGRFVNGDLTNIANRTVELDPPGTPAVTQITSFGEDSKGEMYICDQAGEVWKIVPRATGVAESDMPTLQSQTALGVLGATSPGNAITPGIVPFANAGSRILGVGYLRNAQIRDCPSFSTLSTTCLATHMRLGVWDIDVNSCVDIDSTMLTRTFTFTNRGAGPLALSFVDVIAPLLNGDDDLVRAFEGSTGSSTALLGLFDANNPNLYITNRGFAAGASTSFDADEKAAIEARVAADQPLTNRPNAGPAACAMALGFDFPPVAIGAQVTLDIKTRLQTKPPVSVEPTPDALGALSLRALGAMPFRESLRLGLSLPQDGPVRVEVFDVRGRRVRRLVDTQMDSGPHTLVWDGRDERGRVQGAGLYFVRLHAGSSDRALRVVRVD